MRQGPGRFGLLARCAWDDALVSPAAGQRRRQDETGAVIVFNCDVSPEIPDHGPRHRQPETVLPFEIKAVRQTTSAVGDDDLLGHPAGHFDRLGVDMAIQTQAGDDQWAKLFEKRLEIDAGGQAVGI